MGYYIIFLTKKDSLQSEHLYIASPSQLPLSSFTCTRYPRFSSLYVLAGSLHSNATDRLVTSVTANPLGGSDTGYKERINMYMYVRRLVL